MAKRKVKKTTKKKPEEKTSELKSTKTKTSKTGVFIALVIIAIVAILLIWKFGGSEAETTISDTTIAVVNNNIIYESELDTEMGRLPIELQQALDKNAILSQLIDKKLLIYEAEAAGVEVDDNIEEILTENEITIEELEANVNTQGYSLKEFEDQLKVFEFLDTVVFTDIEVSDEEAEKYYNDNVEDFTLPESVKARHILISTIDPERTDKEALAIMDEVEAALAEDPESFCDLVTEYSEDPGSIASCGEYPAFTRSSSFVQEYKDAAFANEIEKYSITKTGFGYHLIQTLDKISETTLSFEEVKNDLKESLVFEKQKDVFAVYMEGLRTDSEIINCLETPEAEACTEGQTESIEPIEKIDEQESDEDSLEAFAKCLGESGAKMYGAYWCSHCNEQKEMFGDLFENIEYVECAEEDDARAQTIACQEAGISGYPTWVINGQQYPGTQSFETLSKLSGCDL
ncbi:MAG: peptidylprolyl isomerase [archaeon]